MASLQARRASRLGRQRLHLEQMGEGALAAPDTEGSSPPSRQHNHLIRCPPTPWTSLPARLLVFPIWLQIQEPGKQFCPNRKREREQTPPPFSRRKDGKRAAVLWWENPKETSWSLGSGGWAFSSYRNLTGKSTL